MKWIFPIITGIVLVLLVSGCTQTGEVIDSSKCPESCDDNNPCTRDYCSSSTNYQCKYDPIIPCCSNSQCESGENYSSCPSDCQCIPNWQCSDWSECSSEGRQTKICTDLNNCGTETGKPSESQSCTPPPSCVSGWKCKDSYNKAYQNSDCSWTSEKHCSYGCESGSCKSEPVIPQTPEQEIKNLIGGLSGISDVRDGARFVIYTCYDSGYLVRKDSGQIIVQQFSGGSNYDIALFIDCDYYNQIKMESGPCPLSNDYIDVFINEEYCNMWCLNNRNYCALKFCMYIEGC